MNELDDDSPFELDHGSSGLVLVDDTGDLSEEIANGRIELTVDTDLPETSRSSKRKVNHSSYDDDYDYSSTMKYLKREPLRLQKKSPVMPAVKREIQLVEDISSEDGDYYISMIPRDSENDILSSNFVTEEGGITAKQVFVSSDDKDITGHNRMLLLNKGDLSLCSVKESDKDDGELKISVSLPMGLPVNGDITLTVPTVDIANDTVLNQDINEHDPLDHSYYRPGQAIEPNFVDPVRTMWVTTKADKNQLKQSGHTWKTGKWRKEEIDLLKSNIDKYCDDHGIEDAQQIIFHATKEERKNFYPTISVGLNRPLFAVYRRVKRMYDRQNYRGRYTPEEIQQLKDLTAKHGRDWSLIGQQMGRSSDSVKDRSRLLKATKDRGIGKWSDNEELKLAQAVYKVTGKEAGTSITENITWNTVAEIVGSRTEKQCRAKWLNYLNWKLCNGDEWMKGDDKLLIERILAMNCSSEEEIEWPKLNAGWSSVRSPQWLRGKWWSLKRLFHMENPDILTISLNDLLKELLRIVSAQISNSWERYEHYHKLDKESKAKNNSRSSTNMKLSSNKKSESDIAAAKLSSRLDEDGRNAYGRHIRPIAPTITSNSVYTTIANGNLEEKIVSEKDYHDIDSLPRITRISSKLLERSGQKLSQNGEAEINKLSDEYIFTDNLKDGQILEISGNGEDTSNVENTFQLNPTSSSEVFLLQNSESSNQVVLFLSDDSMNFTITPEAFSMLSRAAKVDTSNPHIEESVETEIINNNLHDNHDVMSRPDHHIDITTSRTDVITTSDVLVYQETNNDDDIKNPILSSAIHEVITVGGHENGEDDCYLQSSSPLQGTLLEGTDLASSTIRIDDPH